MVHAVRQGAPYDTADRVPIAGSTPEHFRAIVQSELTPSPGVIRDTRISVN